MSGLRDRLKVKAREAASEAGYGKELVEQRERIRVSEERCQRSYDAVTAAISSNKQGVDDSLKAAKRAARAKYASSVRVGVSVGIDGANSARDVTLNLNGAPIGRVELEQPAALTPLNFPSCDATSHQISCGEMAGVMSDTEVASPEPDLVSGLNDAGIDVDVDIDAGAVMPKQSIHESVELAEQVGSFLYQESSSFSDHGLDNSDVFKLDPTLCEIEARTHYAEVASFTGAAVREEYSLSSLSALREERLSELDAHYVLLSQFRQYVESARKMETFLGGSLANASIGMAVASEFEHSSLNSCVGRAIAGGAYSDPKFLYGLSYEKARSMRHWLSELAKFPGTKTKAIGDAAERFILACLQDNGKFISAKYNSNAGIDILFKSLWKDYVVEVKGTISQTQMLARLNPATNTNPAQMTRAWIEKVFRKVGITNIDPEKAIKLVILVNPLGVVVESSAYRKIAEPLLTPLSEAYRNLNLPTSQQAKEVIQSGKLNFGRRLWLIGYGVDGCILGYYFCDGWHKSDFTDFEDQLGETASAVVGGWVGGGLGAALSAAAAGSIAGGEAGACTGNPWVIGGGAVVGGIAGAFSTTGLYKKVQKMSPDEASQIREGVRRSLVAVLSS